MKWNRKRLNQLTAIVLATAVIALVPVILAQGPEAVPETESAKVKEYEITRSIKLCGPFNPLGTVKKDVLNYTDSKVKPEITYYYKVRAIKNDKSYSGFSNKVTEKLLSS